MKQFWQGKRHGTPIERFAAEGPTASSGHCEDIMRELGHKLKELHINVEDIRSGSRRTLPVSKEMSGASKLYRAGTLLV